MQGVRRVRWTGGQTVRFRRRATVTFSPDGLHLAYAARTASSGTSCSMAARVRPSTMKSSSPLQSRFAPVRLLRCRRGVYGHGGCQRGKAYDSIEPGLVFGPDGAHVAYVATAGEKSFVVVDGVEGQHYDSIVVTGNRDGLTFDSPSAFHYVALKDNKVYLVRESIP